VPSLPDSILLLAYPALPCRALDCSVPFDKLRAGSAGRTRCFDKLLQHPAFVLDSAYSFLPTSSRSQRGHHDAGIGWRKSPTAKPAIPLPKATHAVIAAPRSGLLPLVGSCLARFPMSGFPCFVHRPIRFPNEHSGQQIDRWLSPDLFGCRCC
jgi:hypothetical protein